jgi:hypothetical protein
VLCEKFFNFQGFRHGGENSVKRSILGAFASSGGHFFEKFGCTPDRERCCAKFFLYSMIHAAE